MSDASTLTLSETSLEILALLDSSPHRLRHRDIVSRSDLSKNTAKARLKRLVELELVLCPTGPYKERGYAITAAGRSELRLRRPDISVGMERELLQRMGALLPSIAEAVRDVPGLAARTRELKGELLSYLRGAS